MMMIKKKPGGDEKRKEKRTHIHTQTEEKVCKIDSCDDK